MEYCVRCADEAEDPHLNERGFLGPNGVRKPAPLLGEDTDAVMCDILRYSDEEIATLKE